MGFVDSEVVLYDGQIKVTYHDKAHRYYVSEKQPDGSWGKGKLTKGVTTILDNVLEKKGLLTWPMGLALRELFGFYDFTNEKGERMVGFSKGVGSLWRDIDGDGAEIWLGLDETPDQKTVLPYIQSAAKAWQRKKKMGADVGSLVHDALEQFTLGTPFELTLDRYKEGQEFETPEAEAAWLETAPAELEMAKLAYERFKEWWAEKNPELLGAEFIVYSKELDYCGSTDNRMRIDGKLVMTDYKTSNASASKEAAAPQGVYYSYFIQLGAYAQAWFEMTGEMMDDLLVVSARKDGSFDAVYASDVGLTVIECMAWWRAVAICNKLAVKTKAGLLNNMKEKVDA